MINFLLLGELICLGETFVFFDLNEYKLTIPQKCTDIVMKQIFHELDMKKKNIEATSTTKQGETSVIIDVKENKFSHLSSNQTSSVSFLNQFFDTQTNIASSILTRSPKP